MNVYNPVEEPVHWFLSDINISERTRRYWRKSMLRTSFNFKNRWKLKQIKYLIHQNHRLRRYPCSCQAHRNWQRISSTNIKWTFLHEIFYKKDPELLESVMTCDDLWFSYLKLNTNRRPSNHRTHHNSWYYYDNSS